RPPARASACACLTRLCAPGAPRALRCCPTRRSSDLAKAKAARDAEKRVVKADSEIAVKTEAAAAALAEARSAALTEIEGVAAERSEEHTSELQSREKLVCRLLREKKQQGGDGICVQT